MKASQPFRLDASICEVCVHLLLAVGVFPRDVLLEGAVVLEGLALTAPVGTHEAHLFVADTPMGTHVLVLNKHSYDQGSALRPRDPWSLTSLSRCEQCALRPTDVKALSQPG